MKTLIFIAILLAYAQNSLAWNIDFQEQQFANQRQIEENWEYQQQANRNRNAEQYQQQQQQLMYQQQMQQQQQMLQIQQDRNNIMQYQSRAWRY